MKWVMVAKRQNYLCIWTFRSSVSQPVAAKCGMKWHLYMFSGILKALSKYDMASRTLIKRSSFIIRNWPYIKCYMLKGVTLLPYHIGGILIVTWFNKCNSNHIYKSKCFFVISSNVWRLIIPVEPIGNYLKRLNTL